MNYTLRPYQKEAVDLAVEYFREDNDFHSLIVLPTGSGKSLVIANIAKELDGHVLILQPTKEILQQNIDKLRSYGFEASIYSASFKSKEISKITYATIGSIKSRPDLFKHFEYIILDEAHASNAKGGMYSEFFNSIGNIKIIGLSVAPESIIELVGGPFPHGFVGSIEEAYTILESNFKSYNQNGLEVVDLSNTNVFSRGWENDDFCWKLCKKFIRHSGGGLKMTTINAHCNLLTLTEDHSVYRAIKGESLRVTVGKHTNTKYKCNIECPLSSEIIKGDVLLGDNGSNWNTCEEKIYDLVEIISQTVNKSRAKVQLTKEHEPFLYDYTTGTQRQSMVGRWIRTNSIPLKVYSFLRDKLPSCDEIISEGTTGSIKPYIKLSDWAYLLGFYLGDGWLDMHSGGRIGLIVENSLIDHVYEMVKNIPGVKCNVNIEPVKNRRSKSINIDIGSIFIARLFQHVGLHKKSYDKSIPGEWITSWPEKARRDLLSGLIDSDGCLRFNKRGGKRVAYTTTSLKLAETLLSLLRSLNITGSLHTRKIGLGGIINGRQIVGKRPAYSVQWSYFAQEESNELFKGLRTKYKYKDQKFSELPVRSNIESESKNYVYDIEMEGHPSFVASGILVHNTATPIRLSVDGFGGSILKFLTRTRPRIFSKLLYYVQTGDLYNEGFWSPLQYFDIKGFDRSRLKSNSTGADFDEENLKKYYDEIGFNNRVIKVVERLIDIKRKGIIVFTSFIADSEYLCSKIPAAEMVSSKTPQKDRDRIIQDFRDGKIKVLFNTNVLSVGFDYPELDTVVLARPTKSLVMYYQQTGRACRPHPNKSYSMVVDMVENTKVFGKIEDLRIRDTGNEKWIIESNGKQLTNTYL